MSDELFSVKGKRVLISGGGAGIGKMMAEGLAERGARIFTVSRKQKVLDELVKELKEKRGFDVRAQAADLSKDEDIARVAAQAGDHFGGELDVLINNSGATWGAPLDEYPADGWDKIFDLNVRGLFLLTQKCLPLLRKAAKPEAPARVINIGSISGITCPPDNAWAYHPAKAAVHHLTKNLAKALASDYVTVNAIAPGFFPSRMTAFMIPDGDDSGIASAIPLKRVGRPSDIVGTAVYLASQAGAFTTGAIVVLDGGYAL
jgi:NAD(P)-dependent dehydrogenase (short-subunit alcohol dehydrogenase family)